MLRKLTYWPPKKPQWMSVDMQSDIKLLGITQPRNTAKCVNRIRCFLEPRNLLYFTRKKEGRKKGMKGKKRKNLSNIS